MLQRQNESNINKCHRLNVCCVDGKIKTPIVPLSLKAETILHQASLNSCCNFFSVLTALNSTH
jgi:hypothetical protein